MTSYDLIAIGGGSAGLAASRVASEAGWKTALIEARELGGTCALRGCVPKKVLVAAAQALEVIARAGEHHIAVGEPTLDWTRLIERKQSFIEGSPASFERRLARRGIDLIRGQARFVDRTMVAVNGEEFEARKIVVGVGSIPRPLPFPGAEHVITSEELLNLRQRPESIVFVGGGVVAMELAHVLARAGTRVTVLEILDRPLSGLDSDLVAELVRVSRDIGIEIITGAETHAVERRGGHCAVRFTAQSQRREIFADVVMNGAGRIPAIDDLALEKAGIERTRRGVVVDAYLRSVTNHDVFFAGDAVPNTAFLSPVAIYEGTIAGVNAVRGGELETVDYLSIPAAVYTVPAMAHVGYTAAEAEAHGFNVEVVKKDLTRWLSSRTNAERVAMSKVLIEREDRTIVGAHILGHGAEEIIHTFAFAIKHKITADQLEETPFCFPTYSASIKHMV